MNKTPKIDRKQLKSPDQFVKKGRALFNFMWGHQNQYVPVIIAAVVGVIGYYTFDWWQEKRQMEIWATYVSATKQTDDKKWDKLKEVALQHPGKRAGILATVAVADHKFDEARKELAKEKGDASKPAGEAAEWYAKALSQKMVASTELQLLLIDRGAAIELMQKFDEALGEYKSASETDGVSRGLALLNVGRIYELKSENDKAIETYSKISTDFVDTEFAKMARNYLRRLKSPLFKDSEKL